MTTESFIFLVGDPYKPSFATVTGRVPPPTYKVRILHSPSTLFMFLMSTPFLLTIFGEFVFSCRKKNKKQQPHPSQLGNRRSPKPWLIPTNYQKAMVSVYSLPILVLNPWWPRDGESCLRTCSLFWDPS